MQGEWFQTGDAFLLMYSITSRNSFRGARDILKRILKVRECLVPGDVSMVICGNKSDLEDEREVPKEDGQAFADKYGYPFLEISAREGVNVVESFHAIVRDVKQKRKVEEKKEKQKKKEKEKEKGKESGKNKKTSLRRSHLARTWSDVRSIPPSSSSSNNIRRSKCVIQ